MLLADGKTTMKVTEPSRLAFMQGALAYVKLDVTAITREDLRPFSTLGIKTNVVHGVVFEAPRAGGPPFISFAAYVTPGYEGYIRHHLWKDIIQKVEDLCEPIEQERVRF